MKHSEDEKEDVPSVSLSDQLIKIIQSLGPKNVDSSFIKDPTDMAYFKKMESGVKEKAHESFAYKHRHIAKDELNLIESLLVFNPSSRKMIEELLESPYFSDIRSPALERASSSKIYVQVDALPLEA